MLSTGQQNDDDEYAFFTIAGAALEARLVESGAECPEIRVFGNRAGMASLANVLLWLCANAWRREFLSLTSLPFIQRIGKLSLLIRISLRNDEGNFGRVLRLDRGSQYEWELAEEELQRLALLVHRLASKPEHEYDIVPSDTTGHGRVHLRLAELGRPSE